MSNDATNQINPRTSPQHARDVHIPIIDDRRQTQRLTEQATDPDCPTRKPAGGLNGHNNPRTLGWKVYPAPTFSTNSIPTRASFTIPEVAQFAHQRRIQLDRRDQKILHAYTRNFYSLRQTAQIRFFSISLKGLSTTKASFAHIQESTDQHENLLLTPPKSRSRTIRVSSSK